MADDSSKTEKQANPSWYLKTKRAAPKEMSEDKYGYVEHLTVEVDGFHVTDATATGPRPHDDLVWVGFGMEGRWLSREDAVQLSAAIAKVTASQLCRRKGIGPKEAKQRVQQMMNELI